MTKRAFEVGDTVRSLSELINDPPIGSLCVLVRVADEDETWGPLWAVKWFGDAGAEHLLWEDEMEHVNV